MNADRILTVKQPWADLIMAGVKDVENRTWPVPSSLPHHYACDHCGARSEPDEVRCQSCPSDQLRPDGPFPFLLGIHAATAFARSDVLASIDPWREHMRHFRGEPIDIYRQRKVRGALLGFVTVTGCHHADECPTPPFEAPGPSSLCSPWAQPGAYHWTLADPQPLDTPIPMKGRLGLWRLPDDAEVPA